ncbi:MAG: hypothetical protein K9L74_01130 [Candidatus Izimaplasma sp.]|nr:hypothetical protein [Candidatus Izimaplasma bacterium]
MKKILLFSLLVFLISLSGNTSYGSDYKTFQAITFKNDGGVLLENYSDHRYDRYYDKIKGRRFWGWKVFTGFETEPVTFIKETLYIIYNAGTTPIKETFSFKQEESVKKQYNVSGTIKLSGKGKNKNFSLGLEEKLGFEIDAKTSSEYEEEFEIKVEVDPNTTLKIQICGEGKVSSGVANYYRFWYNAKHGGWEVFIITTEYYSLVKEPINE